MGFFVFLFVFLLGAASGLGILFVGAVYYLSKKAAKNEKIASKVNYPAFARALRDKAISRVPLHRDFEVYLRHWRLSLGMSPTKPQDFIKEKERERKGKEKEMEKEAKIIQKLEKKQRKEEVLKFSDINFPLFVFILNAFIY